MRPKEKIDAHHPNQEPLEYVRISANNWAPPERSESARILPLSPTAIAKQSGRVMAKR
jgi:hypothetical protein